MASSGRTVALAAALGLAASLAGAASLRAPVRVRGSALAPDLFAGYSFTRAGDASLHGWALAGSYPWHGLSLVADLSGHCGSFAGADLGQLGLFVGARQTWRFAGVYPFLEGLLGGVRRTTRVEPDGSSLGDSAMLWGLAVGGGASYPITPRWSARALAQLRLLRGGGVWDRDPRLSIGVAYRLRR